METETKKPRSTMDYKMKEIFRASGDVYLAKTCASAVNSRETKPRSGALVDFSDRGRGAFSEKPNRRTDEEDCTRRAAYARRINTYSPSRCKQILRKMQDYPVTLPLAETWTLENSVGEPYLIQIGFPCGWARPAINIKVEDKVPILYLTDGNSVFLSALDALNRRVSAGFFSAGIIIGISYPLSPDEGSVFSPRRRHDLTFPSQGCGPEEGGSNEFTGFIQDKVRPFVYERIKNTCGALPGKEALYGHSLGGLFTLHTLFKSPGMFDCFIASSPSIWWNGRLILDEEANFRTYEKDLASNPSLMIFVGGDEQNPRQRRGESDERFRERRNRHLERRMIDSSVEMHERLKASGRLQRLSIHVYDGEDHGTVIGCSLGRGLSTFFEDWPYETGAEIHRFT